MSKKFLSGYEDKRFGLLGEKLSHSFSPQIHNALADYEYKLYESEREKLSDFMRENSLSGFNVTIPYKQAVMEYCSEISERAQKIGAVNTVLKRRDGSYFGDNTDYVGFSHMLSELKVDVKGKKAVVLGSGGASKTVQTVLRELGAEAVVVSRSGENNYENIDKHRDAVLLVNATPVGMYPNVDDSPVELSVFKNMQGVCDLIYNPLRTTLLIKAENRGIKTANGLSMLVSQAKAAAEIFTSEAICDEVVNAITEKLSKDTENLVLIGMPGCGKSSVGKLLSKKLCRKFFDTDEEILRFTSKTPSEIITNEGEEAFRVIETKILSKLSKEKGLVIATGGGIVTREENKPLLRHNSKVIYIERDLKLLATEDRPLSKDLEKLFEVREPLYKAFADITVDGCGTVEEAADRIVTEVQK